MSGMTMYVLKKPKKIMPKWKMYYVGLFLSRSTITYKMPLEFTLYFVTTYSTLHKVGHKTSFQNVSKRYKTIHKFIYLYTIDYKIYTVVRNTLIAIAIIMFLQLV